MGRIHQYTSKENLSPVTTGFQDIGAAGRAGAGLEQVGGAVQKFGAAYQQHYEDSEAAKQAADFATTHADLTNKWEKTVQEADPNDPEVAKNFMDNVVSPALEALGDGAKTRNGKLTYEKMKASVASSFNVKTAADQANLTGVAEVNNFLTTKNLVTSSIKTDPHSFESGSILADTALGAIQRKVPPDKFFALKRDMYKGMAGAVITGLADKGAFDEADKKLASGDLDQYLDAADKETLSSGVQSARKAAQADALAAEAAQRRKETAASNKVANDLLDTAVKADGSYKIDPGFNMGVHNFASMPGATPGEVSALINFSRTIAEDEARGIKTKTDPFTYEDFRGRLATLTQAEVAQARADRHLSDNDFTFFRSTINELAADPQKVERERQFNAILNGLKPFIGTPDVFGNILKPQEAQRFLEFSQDSRVIFNDMMGQKKSIRDITTAIESHISAYQVGKDDSVAAIPGNVNMPTLMPRAVPLSPFISGEKAITKMREPGESADDWRKRIGQ